MIEIEAKMAIEDVASLEHQLLQAGGKQGPIVQEVNTFFDTPDHALKTADEGLRLRVMRDIQDGSEVVTITHKGPRAHGPVKARTETEVQVSDARAAAELLTALHFSPMIAFEKHRRYWDLAQCQVAIDTLPHLGKFVEIEGPDTATVLQVREQLGLGHLPLIQASYISMLSTHLSNRGISTNYIGFEDSAADASPAQ